MEAQLIMAALSAWVLLMGIQDELHGRLPNLWLLPALAFFGAWTIGFGQAPTGIGLGDAALGVLAAFGLLLPGYALGMVGAGDVKFLAVMGLFLGPSGVTAVLVVGYAIVMASRMLALGYARVIDSDHYTRPSAEGLLKPWGRTPLGLGLAAGFILQLAYGNTLAQAGLLPG